MEHSNFAIDLNSNPMPETQPQDLIQEVHKMRTEHKELKEMVTSLRKDRDELQSTSRKRKSEKYVNNIHCLENYEQSKRCKCCDDCSPVGRESKSNVSTVHVPIDPSDTSLIVKDGYHWRKYGQKVTKDNNSPRAYYKCSFAPTCPVKKKVQRSVNNPLILVATYEGKHNHKRPSQDYMSIPFECLGSDPVICSNNSRIIQNALANDHEEIENIQKLVVEQMVAHLTSSPSFTAALAAAITGKILEEDLSEDNDDIY